MQQASSIMGSSSLGGSNGGGLVYELHEVLAARLPSLRRSAYRILRNTADAEDAVQDAILSACKHLDQFRGESHIATWLNAIVFNSARMRLRRRPRQFHLSLHEKMGEDYHQSLSDRLPAPGLNPEEEFRKGELAGHLTKSIKELSPTLRRTFQLRDVQGLSIRETANVLDVPIGTVKAQLARARKKLKKSMEGVLEPRLTRGRA